MPEGTVGSSDNPQMRIASADPTAATTAALQREIAHLSDRLDLKIEGVVKSFQGQLEGLVLSYDTRLAAIDRATQIFSDDIHRWPTDLQTAVSGERALMVEKLTTVEVKFDGVQTQLSERDNRVEATAVATRTAVDAALAAAEKARISEAASSTQAAAKAEAGFSKQMDQQSDLYRSTTSAVREQIDDLKTRVSRIEALAIGAAGQKVEQTSNSSMTIAVIGIAVTIILALIAVFSFIQRIPAAPSVP